MKKAFSKDILIPIILLLFSFVIRVYFIGQYFGQDEVYYAGYTKDLVTGKPFTSVFPPFFYILMSPVILLFGDSEIVFHVLLSFMGAVSVVFTYLFGKKFINQWAGVIAAVLLAFNTTHWFYSNFAMLDVPSALFSIIAIYYYWSGYKESNHRSLFIGMVFGLLATGTRYGFFPSLATIGYLILFDRKKFFNRQILVSIFVPLIFFGLWMVYYFTQVQWLWQWWFSYLSGGLNINVPAYFYFQAVYFEYLLPFISLFVMFFSAYLLSERMKIFSEKFSYVFLGLFLISYAYLIYYIPYLDSVPQAFIGFLSLAFLLIYSYFEKGSSRLLAIFATGMFLFYSPLGVKFPRYLMASLPVIYLLVGQMITKLKSSKIIFSVAIILVILFAYFNSVDTINKFFTDQAINKIKFESQEYVNKNSPACSKVYSSTWYGFYYLRDRITDLPASTDALKNEVRSNCSCQPKYFVSEGSPTGILTNETVFVEEKEFSIQYSIFSLGFDGLNENNASTSPIYIFSLKESIVKDYCK